MASVSEFRKHWGDRDEGYTLEEAMEKKAKVDEAHGVGTPESKWNPAKILPDPTRKKGFYVSISTK